MKNDMQLRLIGFITLLFVIGYNFTLCLVAMKYNRYEMFNTWTNGWISALMSILGCYWLFGGGK